MTTPSAIDLCNMMRAFSKRPASHIELVLISQNLASMFNRPSALGDTATTNIVDFCDEIVGQIEYDEAVQAEEMVAA